MKTLIKKIPGFKSLFYSFLWIKAATQVMRHRALMLWFFYSNAAQINRN